MPFWVSMHLHWKAECIKNLPLCVFKVCTQKFLQSNEPSLQFFICQLRTVLHTVPTSALSINEGWGPFLNIVIFWPFLNHFQHRSLHENRYGSFMGL